MSNDTPSCHGQSMEWIRRHALLLAAALTLLLAGLRLAPADRVPGIGWMLIVWALALLAAGAMAPRGRNGSRSE
ncbi:hypothetical protein VSS74_21730 [Conexibacter stalactiti]|uniref:Uncharacterized protein n=1 Tax=Conexibacter stalactiti TaxID=1940611 RepID=A0ABU4HUR3_9ACTN|nr:hypothetical protein [Conexibacter stalactiti]MDW5596983.1 hypothetical protein [Conexibacter stalactiti]MEC5037625.1 hypothetical protein [Conexibacter stalactiti]